MLNPNNYLGGMPTPNVERATDGVRFAGEKVGTHDTLRHDIVLECELSFDISDIDAFYHDWLQEPLPDPLTYADLSSEITSEWAAAHPLTKRKSA